VTLQSLVLSIRIMCKDLWKLVHDIYTSVLTEWNYESISYKPYLTRREIPRITHHVSGVSVVLIDDRRVSGVSVVLIDDRRASGVSVVLIDDRRVSRTHWCCVTCLIRSGQIFTSDV
jgi:hypothetical protein